MTLNKFIKKLTDLIEESIKEKDKIVLSGEFIVYDTLTDKDFNNFPNENNKVRHLVVCGEGEKELFEIQVTKIK